MMDIFSKVWYGIQAFQNSFGVAALRVQVKKNDPKSWQTLSPNDCERLLRIVNDDRKRLAKWEKAK